MPSTTEETGIGPTYEIVATLYVAAALTAVATTVAVLADAPRNVVVMTVGFGGLGLVTAAGIVVGGVGLPRVVHPRPLYASGLAWLPAVAGAATGCVAFATLLADAFHVFAVGETGALLIASFGGFVVGGVGWVLLIVIRNAEARARLAASDDVVEWRARPSAGRRRWWYAASAAVALPLLVGTALTRDLSLVGAVGVPVALAVQGANEQQYWLGDDALVYGNPQVRHLFDRDEVTSVTHSREREEIRIERRGWRPAVTCDTADVDDPKAVVAALTRRRETRGRPR